jgi:hypothetical protein
VTTWHHDALVRALALAAGAAAVLVGAASAHAHGFGSHTGFISTVSTIDPHVPGLLVRVLGGHERLSVSNLTHANVVVFDARGRVLRPIPAGQTRVWADPRIGANEAPPDREGLVRYWRIPGRVGGTRFEIVGFLGYRPPPGADDGDGTPTWAYVAAGVLGALIVAAAVVLPRRVRG